MAGQTTLDSDLVPRAPTDAQTNWFAVGLAAAAIGVLQIGVAISLAALIFAGPLSGGAGRASIGFIVATALASAAVGLRSKMETVIAGAQDTGAIVATAVAASIAASAAEGERVATVFTMLAIAAILTGIVMWLVGRYELSALVRSLPYPVISGFLAGTGWLLLRGGIEVMMGDVLEPSTLLDQMTWTSGQHLLPGMTLALFMLLCVVRKITSVAISVAILAGTVLFHVIGRSVSSLETLEADGWLIGPFPESERWTPILPADLAATNWGVIMSQAGPILAIVAVSVIGLLLNLSGIEAILDGEIDMAHELRIMGGTNAAVGAAGGIVSYHLLGDTALARQLGIRNRIVPLLIAAMSLAVVIIGPDIVALVPRAIAGGVLAGLGISVLRDWFRSSLPRMTRVDQGLSALILAIIAVIGILTGVGAGVVLAALIFVMRYGRTSPVRHVIDAAGSSNVDRPAAIRQRLLRERHRVVAVELQGYLFFGSIARLRETIDAHLEASASVDTVRYVVLDFKRATGVDSTAATGIAAMCQRLTDGGATVAWSALNTELAEELERNGNIFEHAHDDLDHAIAWCEDELVAADREVHAFGANASEFDAFGAAANGVDALDDGQDQPPRLAALFEDRSVRSGDVLIEAGATGRDLYLVASGTLSAWIELSDGTPRRLRKVGPDAVLGEVAFCTGAERTATVIADTDGVVKVLTRQRFDEIARNDPRAALDLQAFLSSRLADRLSSTSAMVRDLSR